MYLSKLGLFLSLFFLLQQGADGQIVEGNFYLATTKLYINFMPPGPADQFGIYQVSYATGQSGQQYYSQWGNQLTLGQFNNGVDESFLIERYDGQQLILVSNTTYYRYELTKVEDQALTASGNILATANGHHFYESAFGKLKQFVEFVLGTSLSGEELQQLRSEAIADFNAAPESSLRQLTDVDQQMTQLYQTADVTQIALARSVLLATIVAAYEDAGETDYFLRLINYHTPILAIDRSTNLAFTQKDFEGYINLYSFYANLAGQTFELDAYSRQQCLQQLITTFEQGDLMTRQSLATIGLLSEYIINYYQQLQPAQQQDYVASMYNTSIYNQPQQTTYQEVDYSDPAYIDSLWPEGVNTREEKQAYLANKQAEINSNNYMFNAMQNMQTQSHMTSLNIIENMGNSGNYWEVVDHNY